MEKKKTDLVLCSHKSTAKEGTGQNYLEKASTTTTRNKQNQNHNPPPKTTPHQTP
jgi:hypothetical protein